MYGIYNIMSSTWPISLLIVVGITLSNILVNIAWITSTYGQTVESPFPQFPMIPPAANVSNNNNSNNTNVTSKASQEPVRSSSSASADSSSLNSLNSSNNNNNSNNTNVTSKALTSQLPSSSITHGVRITTPVKAQQVPVGTSMKISGTSRDNTTSDCHVNVIVNDVKPYQNASATGNGGPNDYSNWTFNLTPNYTLVKQGENK